MNYPQKTLGLALFLSVTPLSSSSAGDCVEG
jgi:hypothetical protein